MFGYDFARERFFMTDIPATCLTNLVGIATLIDDVTGLADDYPDVMVDLPLFSGGRVQPAAWLTDNCMYALNGPPLEATIETPTFALNPNGGAFLYGVTMRGTAPVWSCQSWIIRIGGNSCRMVRRFRAGVEHRCRADAR